MGKMEIADIVGDELYRIWANNSNISPFSPIFPESVLQNSVLFLSLNPSLPPNIKDRPFGPNYAPPWKFLDCRKSFTENHTVKHFEKFFEIKNQINEDWTFLDLLYLRNSNQKDIEALYWNSTGKSFLSEQAMLTLKVIEKIKPKWLSLQIDLLTIYFMIKQMS
jgi:hypothetical protein